VVIAPGTGLGEAVLFFHDGRHHVLASEGGHTDFGPTDLLQLELLRYLMGKFGHISYERICSGIGIPNLYAYFRENRFAPELPPGCGRFARGIGSHPNHRARGDGRECEPSMATLTTFVSIPAQKRATWR
jgi:glucokinase